MKYESKRFDERWGTQQAEAKREVTAACVSNGTNIGEASGINLGGTYWVDPHSGDLLCTPTPWDQHQWVPQPSVTHDFQLTPDPLVELEVLRTSLSTCLICGLGDVFILCSLCRETVKEARQAMLDRMVESINSMGQ